MLRLPLSVLLASAENFSEHSKAFGSDYGGHFLKKECRVYDSRTEKADYD